MVNTFIDSALEELSWLTSDPSLSDSLETKIQAFQVDLRLLKMFLRCLITWDPDKHVDRNLRSSMVSSIESIWDKSGEGLYAAGLLAIHKRRYKDWNMVASKLEEKIQQCKQEIKKCRVRLIFCSLLCKTLESDQLLEFIDEIRNNLNIVNLPAENQIETIKEKLLLLRNFVDFASGRSPNVKDLKNFMVHVHAWANMAAFVTCLYWVGGLEDDEIGSRMNLWLTDLLRKVNPCTPEFIEMCFAVMKSIKSSRSDTFVFGEFVSCFVDFLLEKLPFALKDDSEILREGLIFLISFLVESPAKHYEFFTPAKHYEFFTPQSHIDPLLGDASRLIPLFDGTEENLTRDRPILLDFLMRIQILRRQIEKLHVRMPSFSWPMTDKIGFVEQLFGKIEDLIRTMNRNSKIAPFAKHQIFGVNKELMSLRQPIHVIWEMQKEHKELKDLLDEMINVAYQAELVVNSSFTIDYPIWYHLSCLFLIIQKIKDVQNEFVKVKTNQIYETSTATGVVSKLPSVYMPPVSGFNEVVVGFVDEEQVLTERITRGTTHLDIVPIVGMGGLGKTTLAKKLFNESLVKSHFNVQAFCYVGQENSSKHILLDILKELLVVDDGIRAMTKDDLAHRLYKCLKGRNYLIIMDDIWDVTAWKGVKDSFPDDNNGSRVVFTTRISNAALQANSNCTPHYLRFFSSDESWELLQTKVFHKLHCPSDLEEVGKLIAEKCNGLPLAVVVIAGLLARIPANLSSWNKIADDLSSYASTLGCMDTLELSYKHLPETLKSCLLYFGAFVKEKNVSAKRLMLLWAAEEFLPKNSERNSLIGMAKQYMNDLVDRSLVIVHQRGSTGGIKRCGVHDLIRDLCISKAREDHFFHIMLNNNKIFSICEIYEQYRLCINEWASEDNDDGRRGHSAAHTLLYYPISGKHVYSYELSFSFRNFKHLLVLDLQEIVYGIYESFPEEVTTLVFLRYLALTTERFSLIPSVISNLWNLETFILQRKHYRKISLPETIWMMKRLRHVDVGSDADVCLDNDVGKDSSILPNIESFSSVTIAFGGYGEEETLRRLSKVRKLSCCIRPCWDSRKKLHQLPKLDQYLTMLESLNVVSDGIRGPCVFSFPTTLKKLSLSRFYLPWSDFSTIANLPCLEVLKLRSNAFEGSKWDVENEEFPTLKYLELHELNVVEWIASVDTFPCLEQLIVIYCHYLNEIPACFGESATLKDIRVYISNEGAENSAIQIQKEQLEIGNSSLQVRVSETVIVSSQDTDE